MSMYHVGYIEPRNTYLLYMYFIYVWTKLQICVGNEELNVILGEQTVIVKFL